MYLLRHTRDQQNQRKHLVKHYAMLLVTAPAANVRMLPLAKM
jgi:hypothetical protein